MRFSFVCLTISFLAGLISIGGCASPSRSLSAAPPEKAPLFAPISSSKSAVFTSPEAAQTAFTDGVASYRAEQWEAAAKSLAESTDGFPLLADYALYYRADALFQLNRYAEALIALHRLMHDFPETPLTRSAELLNAELLFASKDFPGALAVYQAFTTKYSAGSDVTAALYHAALCRIELADKVQAAADLRAIWLNYPASREAVLAQEALQQLAAAGVSSEPYTAEELFKRGATLFNQRQYQQSAATCKAIPLEGTTAEFQTKVVFKTGQALLEGRHYREAERTLASLQGQKLETAQAQELSFLLARARNKSGKEEEALSAYLLLARQAAGTELADNAQWQAALIKKSQGKGKEALAILERLLKVHPETKLHEKVLWEIAWSSYAGDDFKKATTSFRQLLHADASREKALYWLAKSLQELDDPDGAAKTWTTLLDEFPLGFYALRHKKEAGIPDRLPSLTADITSLLPVPAGFERVKALTRLGLQGEAKRELALLRKKSGDQTPPLELARLYLDMGEYSAGMALFPRTTLRKLDQDNLLAWGINYPRAFNEQVSNNADRRDLPANLVYAVIRAESNFLPGVISPAGAVGLMQIMPATAKALLRGKVEKFESPQLTQPELNIELGVRHLSNLKKLYNGNLTLAIAAYNGGSGNVERWRKSFGNLREDEFIETIPFQETRDYVKKVLAGMEVYTLLYGPATAAGELPLPEPPETVQQSQLP